MYMTDIENEYLTKIREWAEADHRGPCYSECGCDTWPSPPEYAEYRVEGQMRVDVLKRVGRPDGDQSAVRLITGCIEGGYSEFTVEHDYPIEVWIDENGQTQRVFEDTAYWGADSLAAFMRWIGEVA